MRFIAILLLSLLMVSGMAGQKKPVIKNKYILQVNPTTGKIEKTSAVDSIIWLGNGFGLIRVIYKPDGFNPKKAGTKPLKEDFLYSNDPQSNHIAWGIIDTTGKFLLEPDYLSIDLWKDMKGFAYKREYEKNGCGYMYSTYIDINRGFVNYLGDNIDYAQRITNDYVLLKTMTNRFGLYDIDMKAIKDTAYLQNRENIWIGKNGTMIRYSFFRPGCETLKTLENFKVSAAMDNNLFINYNGISVYGPGKKVILPEAKFADIQIANKMYVAKRYSASPLYVILDKDFNPVTKDYRKITYNSKGYWIFEEGDGLYDFASADLGKMNSDTLAYYKESYAAAYKRGVEYEKFMADRRDNNPDLASYICGIYDYFNYKVGDKVYEFGRRKGDKILINRDNFSQTRIQILISASKEAKEDYKFVELSLSQNFSEDLRLDPSNSMRILIGTESRGGWYDKKTKQLYIKGRQADGTMVEVFSTRTSL